MLEVPPGGQRKRGVGGDTAAYVCETLTECNSTLGPPGVTALWSGVLRSAGVHVPKVSFDKRKRETTRFLACGLPCCFLAPFQEEETLPLLEGQSCEIPILKGGLKELVGYSRRSLDTLYLYNE